MKWLIYAFFVIIYLLVAFFGLGPVLLADGTTTERVITFLFVVAIYILLTFVFRFVVKKKDRN
ncbi:MAG: hypothetical protein GYA02_07620 [Clostridiaceae bacterium]|nr:hypothetical protein [Clostridiaceae bacterium]